MRMFEINEAIEECIDHETGEIIDPEKLANLQIEHHKKLRAYAFYYLQNTLDAKDADNLMRAYSAKKKSLLNTADWFKKRLAAELNGAKMNEPEFKVFYRKSESVEVTDIKEIPDEFLIQQDPKVDRIGLKKALEADGNIKGANLVEKQNIQIALPRVPKKE